MPKCVTLNDLNRYFALNSVFAPAWLAPTVKLSKNNCVKTDKDRHILSATQIFDRDFSFRQYNVCAVIRLGSLERAVGSRINDRHEHLLLASKTMA